MNIIESYYPGYVRKALSFTIDDGNVQYDRKFLDIVKPYGIKGTFNLCSHNLGQLTKEQYREFYSGYEIANHCKYHPFVFRDDKEYVFTDEPFDEKNADTSLVYKAKIDKQYLFKAANGWRMVTDADTYIKYAEDSRKELAEFFGLDDIGGFVWPYGKQVNQKLWQALTSAGYYGIRKTGDTRDLDGFAIPKNRNDWSYNANNVSLLQVAKMYEEYPDDGTLKFFCFGVHSVDFERSGNWNELEKYAKTYGNRPNDYWYASVGEVFAYEDAISALVLSDDKIENDSKTDVYLKINGKKVVIKAGGSVKL